MTIAPLWEKMIADGKAKGAPICEEAGPLSGNSYFPCGQPARKVMLSARDGRSYDMCDACADHNTRRGMVEIATINRKEQ